MRFDASTALLRSPVSLLGQWYCGTIVYVSGVLLSGLYRSDYEQIWYFALVNLHVTTSCDSFERVFNIRKARLQLIRSRVLRTAENPVKVGTSGAIAPDNTLVTLPPADDVAAGFGEPFGLPKAANSRPADDNLLPDEQQQSWLDARVRAIKEHYRLEKFQQEIEEDDWHA